MAVINLYAQTGTRAGTYDTKTSTYLTVRDNKLNHIFWKAEFGNAVAISNNIIKEIIKIEKGFGDIDLEGIKLRFILLNFEPEVSYYEISLNDFLIHSNDTYFAGKENSDGQKRCALKHFYRININQRKVEEYVKTEEEQVL